MMGVARAEKVLRNRKTSVRALVKAMLKLEARCCPACVIHDFILTTGDLCKLLVKFKCPCVSARTRISPGYDVHVSQIAWGLLERDGNEVCPALHWSRSSRRTRGSVATRVLERKDK